MIQFQQSEQTAERRRWILVLVDSADGVTGLTGQTGTVFVSKNGAAGVASTNSIVEVDAGDMPGHYYIEMTAAELDTLGWVSISKKTASSLAFHDRAIVSYNDPYQSVGGFSGGTAGDSFKLTKKHIEAIAEEVWKYKVEEEVTAREKLLQAADHPVVDLSGISKEIGSIVMPEVDLEPVLERIDLSMEWFTKSINEISFPEVHFPEVKDYEAQLTTLAEEINKLPKHIPDAIEFDYERIEDRIDGFNNLIDKVDEVSGLVKQNSDSITVKLGENEQAIVSEFKLRVKEVLEYLVNLKYDLEESKLQEMNKE